MSSSVAPTTFDAVTRENSQSPPRLGIAGIREGGDAGLEPLVQLLRFRVFGRDRPQRHRYACNPPPHFITSQWSGSASSPRAAADSTYQIPCSMIWRISSVV